MKLFAIIQSGVECHIKRTDTSSIPRNAIIAEADTYEQAVVIRDANRNRIAESRSKATDRWHDEWTKAEERGDMARLLHLGHADRY